MPVKKKKKKKLYFWKEKPTNKAESTPKMAEIKKDKTRLARFTPGELTRIKGDIRGAVKTAAVPSGPALIAREAHEASAH